MMTERSRSSPPKSQQKPPANNYNDGRLEWGKSTAYGHDNGGSAGSTRSHHGDEEEEEEEGAIRPDEEHVLQE